MKPAPTAERVLRIYFEALFAAYGPQQWWPAQTPLGVVVGAYLTQNTSWLAVERSIANLAAHGVLHLEGLRTIDEEQLRLLIRPSGFMLRKAAAIKAFVTWLDRVYAGSIEALAAQPTADARRQLLLLPGVGDETADAILLYALGHPVMVADEYLRRIAVRHGLAEPSAKYRALQQLAERAFEDVPHAELLPIANEFHALAVAVGKRHCRGRAHCEGCPLERFLPRQSEEDCSILALHGSQRSPRTD
jgi:endonuclease-3 related protein